MKVDLIIFDFSDYREFLKAVVSETVEKKGKEFGYRYLSSVLDWPATYLNDVVNDRKKLSIKKAWELALHFEFNALEKEYFSLLVLKESGDEVLEDHAKESLAKWTSVERVHSTNLQAPLHFNIIVPLILRVIHVMEDNDCSEENIVRKVKDSAIGSQFKESEIIFILHILTEAQYLNRDPLLYSINKFNHELWGEDLSGPNSPWLMQELFIKYSDCLTTFLKNRKSENFHLKSSYCLLTMEQMKMVAKKIDELRDITLSFDKKNTQETIGKDKLSLIQYNYNLIEILKSST